MSVRPWSLVRIPPYGHLHFTNDGKRTHCGVALQEGSKRVDRADLQDPSNCSRCMRWANAYEDKLREEYGDIEAAREAMQDVSH